MEGDFFLISSTFLQRITETYCLRKTMVWFRPGVNISPYNITAESHINVMRIKE